VSSDEVPELAGYSPAVTRQVVERVGPLLRKWFRAEMHGLDAFPATGSALVVSNHSGGMLTPDVLLFGSAFYRRFGYDERPLYTLAHYGVVMGPLGDLMPKVGVIEASRENAAAALASGGVVLVFPGGDYDSYRPTTADKVIDFNGRTGYVRTAIAAGVPIVPAVSIGGQESQLFLTRGNGLAKLLGLTKARMDILPITFGFPFGFSVLIPPTCRCRRRSSLACSSRSTWSTGSDRIQTSTRSTRTFVTSCRSRCTNCHASDAFQCWAERWPASGTSSEP
jgi:1-acyl-sn-glycerol-3-phosphate acyltransferase